jgi:hypothetical protein
MVTRAVFACDVAAGGCAASDVTDEEEDEDEIAGTSALPDPGVSGVNRLVVPEEQPEHIATTIMSVATYWLMNTHLSRMTPGALTFVKAVVNRVGHGRSPSLNAKAAPV